MLRILLPAHPSALQFVSVSTSTSGCQLGRPLVPTPTRPLLLLHQPVRKSINSFASTTDAALVVRCFDRQLPFLQLFVRPKRLIVWPVYRRHCYQCYYLHDGCARPCRAVNNSPSIGTSALLHLRCRPQPTLIVRACSCASARWFCRCRAQHVMLPSLLRDGDDRCYYGSC